MSNNNQEYSEFVQRCVIDKAPYSPKRKNSKEFFATMNVTNHDWARIDAYKRECGLSKREIITKALDVFFEHIKKEKSEESKEI